MRFFFFSLISIFVFSGCITKIIPKISLNQFENSHVLLKNPPSPLVAELLTRLQLDYVDMSRFSPSLMLTSSLQNLNDHVPEVTTKLQNLNSLETPISSFSLHIHKQIFQIPVTNINHLSELNLTLQKTLNVIKKNVESTKFITAEKAIVKGILATLDPHSSVIFSQEYQNLPTETTRQFGGIGVEIKYEKNKGLKILQVFPNTPAATQGLHAGEWITHIEDQAVRLMDFKSAREHLQGMIGTPVKLKITKPDNTQYQVSLSRAIINHQSIKIETITTQTKKILFIKIKFFQSNTDTQLYDAFNNLDEVSGIVIDLRNNLGGLLQQAVLTTNFFLPPHLQITSTQGTLSQSFKSEWVLKNPKLEHLPLVVLINRASASGSEIVASALKDRPNTVLIGEETFGKGSVQNLQLFQKHALKLTVAKYLKPNGESLQAVGETPHIHMRPIRWDTTHHKIFLSIKDQSIREKQLARTFQWGQATNAPDISLKYVSIHHRKPTSLTSNPKKILNFFETSKQVDQQQDFIKNFAIQSLKQVKSSQDEIKEIALKLARTTKKTEEEKLITTLQSAGINWKKIKNNLFFDKKPKIELQSSWKFDQDLASQKLGDTQTLIHVKLHLKNLGKAVDRTKIRVSLLNKPMPRLEIPIGYLEAKTSISQDHTLLLPYADIFQIQVQLVDSENHILTQHQKIMIPNPPKLPQLQIQLHMRDNGEWGSRGNGNGLVEPHEKIALQLQVTNHSKIATGQLQSLITPASHFSKLQMIRRSDQIKTLQAHETKILNFMYMPKKRVETIDQLELFHTHFPSYRLIYRFNLSTLKKSPVCCHIPSIDFKAIEYEGTQNLETQKHHVNVKAKIRTQEKIDTILIFNNTHKVLFFDHQSSKFDFKKRINLQKGINQIKLVVTMQSGITIHRAITLWRSHSDNLTQQH